MRVARWVLGITGAVVLLAVAAVLMATLLINPDRYKGDIERAVRRGTGLPLVLEGHLRLTWFPWLGVRTGAARLGAPAGTDVPDLVDWQSADVRVRLLPLLLHRQLEVARIRIIGADIHLRRGPHGEGNWDVLANRLQRQSGPEPTPATGEPARPASSAWSAEWGGLELEDGTIDYLDERSREHVSLEGWRLSVGPWRAGEPLSLSTSFTLHAETPASGASAANARALRLPAAGVPVSLEAPRLRIQFSPLAVTAPEWLLGIAQAKLTGAARAGWDRAGQPSASGSLAAAVPSLRGLARALGIGAPQTRDPAVLGALSLSGSWRYQNGALTLDPLTARLDSTALSGWIARSGAPKPVWTFALRADHVDFGRYLTHAKEQKPIELPVSALRALHAQGTLELGRAQIEGTTLKDVRLQVQ